MWTTLSGHPKKKQQQSSNPSLSRTGDPCNLSPKRPVTRVWPPHSPSFAGIINVKFHCQELPCEIPLKSDLQTTGKLYHCVNCVEMNKNQHILVRSFPEKFQAPNTLEFGFRAFSEKPDILSPTNTKNDFLLRYSKQHQSLLLFTVKPNNYLTQSTKFRRQTPVRNPISRTHHNKTGL